MSDNTSTIGCRATAPTTGPTAERMKAASKRTCAKATACCVGPTAIKYEGEFLEDHITGRGVFVWANSDRYEGDFVGGERTGQGTYTWHNGERYEGRFEGDQLQGPGKFFWPDGRKYEGNFVDGKKSGTGTFEWPNGNRYVGAFANDAREGLGTFYWRDGTVYEGTFDHNKMQGFGVKRTVDGQAEFQQWRDGALVLCATTGRREELSHFDRRTRLDVPGQYVHQRPCSRPRTRGEPRWNALRARRAHRAWAPGGRRSTSASIQWLKRVSRFRATASSVRSAAAVWRASILRFRRSSADWSPSRSCRRNTPQIRASAKRFVREARIIAQLSHPNIVQVHDAGVNDQCYYLVMEYLRGGDLNRRLKRGLHMQAAISVVKDIARGLDNAHSKGFVHRDIKPENILFREDGSAVLSDFGVARVISSGASITRHGTVVGTPQYMSPEQATGKPLDGRSDIYSLGVVFYRMLTGEVPFKADSAVAVGIRHLQDPVPRLPGHLSAMQTVVDRFLAKKPEARFQTGAEVIDALDGVRAAGMVPNTVIKTEVVNTAEIRAIGDSVSMPVLRDGRTIRAEPDQRPETRAPAPAHVAVGRRWW